MNKIIVNVPEDKSIKFLSDWKAFNLPNFPCILNKQITGCGFTEWCINNDKPIILCSPRKVLLSNKEGQHRGLVYYAKSEFDKSLAVDEESTDITVNSSKKKGLRYNIDLVLNNKSQISDEEIKKKVLKYKSNVKKAYEDFLINNIIPKFLVTYDSFGLLAESLRDIGVLENFHVIVDEFQSIFMDSRFKAETELTFVNELQKHDKVCYVSATPMMENYLDLIEEFKDLPYYEMNWGELGNGRVELPYINPIMFDSSVTSVATDIINKYKFGEFEKDITIEEDGSIKIVESREVVFFVNSVKNICDIIKKNKLTMENTTVLCSDSTTNREKVRKAFGVSKKVFDNYPVNYIPEKDKPHKMFTFCTRTAYLGADFYSTNAKTVVISNSSIECLAVDISLDLPQILGRQRLDENPWRNCADFYYKIGTGLNDIKEKDFQDFIDKKLENTDKLLEIYKNIDVDSKSLYVYKLLTDVNVNHYKIDYIGINKKGGSIPLLNQLVVISERRAFDIQKEDYVNRFSVLSRVNKNNDRTLKYTTQDTEIIKDFIKRFNSSEIFIEKMKLICSILKNRPDFYDRLLKLIPKNYKNYITILGVDKIISLGCQRSRLEEKYHDILGLDDNKREISEKIYGVFNEGDRVTRAEIKDKLTEIYDSFGIYSKPTALEIGEYFEVERTRIINKVTKRMDEGFRLIKRLK